MIQRLSDLADTIMWPRPVPPVMPPHTVTFDKDWLWLIIPLTVIGADTLLSNIVTPVYSRVKSELYNQIDKWKALWTGSGDWKL